MDSNIKILIITDNTMQWIQNVINNLSSNIQSKKYNNTYYISNGLFNVEIKSEYPLNMRGACYSCCILDKNLGYDIEDHVLIPCIKGYIQYTSNYKFLNKLKRN